MGWFSHLDLAQSCWEADVEIPGLPQHYALVNPAILAFRDNILSSYRAQFPNLPDATLTKALEQSQWISERAASSIRELSCNALILELVNRFPAISTDRVRLALERAAFDVEAAAAELEASGRDALARRARALCALGAGRGECTGGRVEQCSPPSPASAKKRKPALAVRLRGLSDPDPERAVLNALGEADAEPPIGRVDFVTGKRAFSPNGTPLLDFLLAKRYEGKFVEENTGMVRAFKGPAQTSDSS
jgi:hypothetical protein